MNDKLLIATSSAILLSGCSTMFNGSTDDVNIRALGTEDKTTECTVTSNGKEYYANGRVDSISVDRDSDALTIHCKNEFQEGKNVVESDFMTTFLVLDILWDACILTLSCPIDLATGNFFDYPENILVDMNNLNGDENSLLTIHHKQEEERIAKEKALKKLEQDKMNHRN